MIRAVLFWICIGAMAYIYVGYAIGIRILSKLAGREVKKAPGERTITVVVTAFNEERGIRKKLEGLVALQYPTPNVQILVASDGSTDKTDKIVTEFGHPHVQLLRVEGRVGKTQCQNIAVENAVGEIVVFTDATTTVAQDAILHMSENFADETVGCVAAQLVYVGKGNNLTATGGTAYWNYEVSLRTAESRLASLVGVSGCLYAVRRRAYRPIRADLISDFVIAMHMRELGLRTVLEPLARCLEDTLDRSSQEFSMRVRVAIRSISALVAESRFLNPIKYGLFSIQLLSHKALRYASPLIWIIAFACCASLANAPVYLLFTILQLLLVGAGLLGLVLHSKGAGLGILSKPYYFLLTNVASLVAVIRYVKGERVRIWNPVRS